MINFSKRILTEKNQITGWWSRGGTSAASRNGAPNPRGFSSTSPGLRKAFFCRFLLPTCLMSLLAGCTDPAAKGLSTGWKQLAAGQHDQALVTAQNILLEAPSSPRAAEVLYLKGRALEAKTAETPTEQRKNLIEAASAYRQALGRHPNRKLTSQLYAGIANTCYWMDDFQGAWSNWVKAYDLSTDPASRSYTLYRIGLCQQRLGRFAEADVTFAAVQREYPNTDAAARAARKMGARSFAVQVATFASPQTAESAMNTLRREGFVPTKMPNSQGQTVVTITPFRTYQQAQQARMRLVGLFPDALIVP
ncbi:MAG: tetratricopeptide repeat protein [Phycisphaerae bacterium]|nr:tetratricopeptide repeat protein [Phycisphaerae bacterium]MDW8261057.1 tetratricopeptide repeat protein [Phycisphaerales bacterium]